MPLVVLQLCHNCNRFTVEELLEQSHRLVAVHRASMSRMPVSTKLGQLQDVLFTPQKSRSASNSLDVDKSEVPKTNATETLKAAAAMFPPKRVWSRRCASLTTACYAVYDCCHTVAGIAAQTGSAAGYEPADSTSKAQLGCVYQLSCCLRKHRKKPCLLYHQSTHTHV